MPPAGSVAAALAARLTPHIYSDAEIAALMAARGEALSSPFSRRHLRDLIEVHSVSGIRFGEAARLLPRDVDFGRSCWSCSMPTSVHRCGRSPLTPARSPRWRAINSSTGGPLTPSGVSDPARQPRRQPTGVMQVTNHTLRRLVTTGGDRGARWSGAALVCTTSPPLRREHSDGLARDEVDVDGAMPLLSKVLGHAKPSSTYWYLEAVPELMGVAGRGRPCARRPRVSSLAPTLEAFFTTRLALQQEASPATVAAYRDTIRLLVRFASERTHRPPKALDLADLDAPLIGAFLDHLERQRHNSARTRNARLRLSVPCSASPRSITPSMGHRSACAGLPQKRCERALICFLTRSEVEALLAAPDRSCWCGRRIMPCSCSPCTRACGSASSQDCAVRTSCSRGVRTCGGAAKGARTRHPARAGRSCGARRLARRAPG